MKKVRKDGKTLRQILSGLGDLLDGLSGLTETGADVLERVGSRSGRTASVTYGWSIGTAAGPRSRLEPDGGDTPPPGPPPRGAEECRKCSTKATSSAP